jgi:hypothetical protein
MCDCSESILALFYHPNSLQWTEIHHGQGLFAVLLLSHFKFLQLAPSVGNCTSSFGVMMSQFIRKLRYSTKSNGWYFCSLRQTQQREKDSRFTYQVCQTTIQNISDIFITIGSSRTKDGKIRTTLYFVVSFDHSNWFDKEQKGKKLTKANVVHLGCKKHLLGFNPNCSASIQTSRPYQTQIWSISASIQSVSAPSRSARPRSGPPRPISAPSSHLSIELPLLGPV